MSVSVGMLRASVVTYMFMPFQLVIYDVFFIAGIGVFYLLLYSIGGRWHLEGVVATIMLVIMLSVAVPLLGE